MTTFNPCHFLIVPPAKQISEMKKKEQPAFNPLVFSALDLARTRAKRKEQKRVPFFLPSMGLDERGDAASEGFSVRERKRKRAAA